MFSLSESAWLLCDQLASRAEKLNIAVTSVSGARLIDCGVQAPGGLEAGRLLAEICLAGLGKVDLVPLPGNEIASLGVTITTDQPRLACMASQYAGWQISVGKFFAMGSGPMRAVAAREPLFEKIGVREKASRVVGVLETSKLPTADVFQSIADACSVSLENVTLLVARTASLAGTLQVVARSLETALHKLNELDFDLQSIVSGVGVAPLPPVAGSDLVALGRTNDAILYGGEVTLWVRDDDERLAALGPKIPSSASHDYGAPFADIFERAGRDFYKIDPHLFSPALVTFNNLTSGRTHRFGQLRPDLLKKSFTSP